MSREAAGQGFTCVRDASGFEWQGLGARLLGSVPSGLKSRRAAQPTRDLQKSNPEAQSKSFLNGVSWEGAGAREPRRDEGADHEVCESASLLPSRSPQRQSQISHERRCPFLRAANVSRRHQKKKPHRHPLRRRHKTAVRGTGGMTCEAKVLA